MAEVLTTHDYLFRFWRTYEKLVTNITSRPTLLPVTMLRWWYKSCLFLMIVSEILWTFGTLLYLNLHP